MRAMQGRFRILHAHWVRGVSHGAHGPGAWLPPLSLAVSAPGSFAARPSEGWRRIAAGLALAAVISWWWEDRRGPAAR